MDDGNMSLSAKILDDQSYIKPNWTTTLDEFVKPPWLTMTHHPPPSSIDSTRTSRKRCKASCHSAHLKAWHCLNEHILVLIFNGNIIIICTWNIGDNVSILSRSILLQLRWFSRFRSSPGHGPQALMLALKVITCEASEQNLEDPKMEWSLLSLLGFLFLEDVELVNPFLDLSRWISDVSTRRVSHHGTKKWPLSDILETGDQRQREFRPSRISLQRQFVYFLQNSLHYPPLVFACWDNSVVGDQLRLQSLIAKDRDQTQGAFPLLCIATCTDACIVCKQVIHIHILQSGCIQIKQLWQFHTLSVSYWW